MIHLPAGRYHVYLRLSQDRYGDEVAVARQRAELMPSIEANPDAEIVDWYVDPDRSATKENVIREEFERLLSTIKPGERVLTWHTDRFVRTSKDLQRIIEAKCTVFALYAGYFDLSTPAGIAVARTQVAWAEYEGQQKALRQKASHKQRAGKGQPFLGGDRPFGFDKAGGTYVERRDEADAVRLAYELLVGKGASLATIARHLNDAGIRTSKGAEWTGNAVRQILIQPRNAGILTYRGEEVGKGSWQPLVTETLFRQAQRLLSDPARHSGGPRLGRHGVIHWLVGVASCGVCGGMVRGARRSGEEFYACRLGHCSARSAWLDAEVAAVVLARLSGTIPSLRASDQEDERDLTLQLEALYAELDELLIMKKERRLSLREYVSFRDDLESQVREIRQQMSKTKGLPPEFGMPVDKLVQIWTDAGPLEKRRLAQMTIDRLEIYPRQRGAAKRLPGVAKAWFDDEVIAL